MEEKYRRNIMTFIKNSNENVSINKDKLKFVYELLSDVNDIIEEYFDLLLQSDEKRHLEFALYFHMHSAYLSAIQYPRLLSLRRKWPGIFPKKHCGLKIQR